MDPFATAHAPALNQNHLRENLLKLVLRTSAVLGMVVYVPSVYMAWKNGFYGLIAVDTLALSTVFGLLIFQRTPYRWRAGVACFIYYVLGVGLLMSVGAISQIYLFGFSVVTVLLFGVRAGLFAAILSAASLLAITALRFAAPEMAMPAWHHTFGESVVITINFALVNTLLTLAVGTVISAVNGALTREIASGVDLEKELSRRVRAETDRNRVLSQLQLQIERMPLAYLLTDRNMHFVRWNPTAKRLFGYTEEEVLGRHPFDVIVPASAQPAVAGIFDQIKSGNMNAHGEATNCTKDGTEIVCEWHNTPLFDESGAFDGLLSLAQDITERRRLEEQLRQSQKMDAVGQLAGGIAHDFNNLLSVVLSYSDMVLADLKEDDPVRNDVAEIRRAGGRAADLTRQLLTFSRQQVVEPKVLNLNEALEGVEKMLRRLLGEDIEFTLLPGTDLGRVRADPGSIEQVIVNLTVNARDAMPLGGKLTIETSNVVLDEAYAKAHFGAKAGPHVMLSVADTGTGMDKATVARVFEPFFTTKELGKGTGLGLSTVFGIVQQSGGTVWVYSEPGVGTVFKVYLPTVAETATSLRSRTVTTPLHGTETVLLVEDEPQVREATKGILLRYGYTVIDAGNPGEALLLCEQHEGPIALLLTDVVMPKLSGPMLAKRLMQLRPAMKVICMSGYTDDAALRHGLVDGEFAFLQKPLTVESLTQKIRNILDA